MPMQRENPFNPGPGLMPPLLAGREREQNKLHKALDKLLNGTVAPRGMLLSGPRGMGKTVLLEWFLQEANGNVDVLATSAQNIDSIANLALFVDPSLERKVRSSGTKVAANIGGVAGASVERSLGETIVPGWSRHIRAKIMADHPPGDGTRAGARGRPLIIAVDEAHTLDPEVVVALLNIYQDMVKQNVPLWLIMVGTPDLRDRLRNAGKPQPGALDDHSTAASFVERCENLTLLALDDAATRRALLEPLQSGGCTVDAMPLQQMVPATQNYPYFIQVLGKAVWEAAQQNAGHVDAAVGVPAQQQLAAEISTLYQGRFDELNKELPTLATQQQCLSAAYEVARYWLMHDKKPLSLGMMVDCLNASALPAAAYDQMVQRFKHTGFMVNAIGADDGASVWTLGIPSLANFIVQTTTPGMLPSPTPTPTMGMNN